jgi:hypothetical protein
MSSLAEFSVESHASNLVRFERPTERATFSSIGDPDSIAATM